MTKNDQKSVQLLVTFERQLDPLRTPPQNVIFGSQNPRFCHFRHRKKVRISIKLTFWTKKRHFRSTKMCTFYTPVLHSNALGTVSRKCAHFLYPLGDPKRGQKHDFLGRLVIELNNRSGTTFLSYPDIVFSIGGRTDCRRKV